jgi:DNA-binding NarL/FixJ family response regulator
MATRTEQDLDGKQLIKDVKRYLSADRIKEHKAIEREMSRVWRGFWVRAANAQGYSHAVIARAFEISEGTVRNDLKEK